jgi:transcription antitermination factor NusA-like protein
MECKFFGRSLLFHCVGTVAADWGMVSQESLATFKGHKPPVGYIVGVRMRRQKEVSTELKGRV